MQVSLFENIQFYDSDTKIGGNIILFMFIGFICLYILIFWIIVPAWCFNFPNIFKIIFGPTTVLTK